MNFYKKNFYILILFLFSTSCAPTYFFHTKDKITILNKNKIDNVYIKTNADDNYGVYEQVIKNVKEKLTDNNINIVDNKNKANFTLELKIKNIAIGVDYDFTNSIINSLLSNEIKPEYVFDTNNNPHINNETFLLSFDKNKYIYRNRKISPSILYTIIGSGTGFTVSYILAGTTIPVAFGFLGGLIVGGTTYAIYNYFKKVGIIINYEVIIEEKLNYDIKHNRKILFKLSSNIADDMYYSYNNHWLAYSSHNIAIAMGSKIFINKMLTNICPTIASNIVSSLI